MNIDFKVQLKDKTRSKTLHFKTVLDGNYFTLCGYWGSIMQPSAISDDVNHLLLVNASVKIEPQYPVLDSNLTPKS